MGWYDSLESQGGRDKENLQLPASSFAQASPSTPGKHCEQHRRAETDCTGDSGVERLLKSEGRMIELREAPRRFRYSACSGVKVLLKCEGRGSVTERKPQPLRALY